MNENEERRSHTRLNRSYPLEILRPGASWRGLLSVRTRNVSAGGLYCRCFHAAGLTRGDRALVRLGVPEILFNGSRTEYSWVLDPHLVGAGRVVRIDPIEVQQVRGWGVAIEFEEPLRFACPEDWPLTAAGCS